MRASTHAGGEIDPKSMWIGDETWKLCPECGWGYARILALLDDYRVMALRCRAGHAFEEETSAPERLHLNAPESPLPPRRYSVHRGRSEDGPWTRGVAVRDYADGERVIDRWREERPDLWYMLAIDGSPRMRAAPVREMP